MTKPTLTELKRFAPQPMVLGSWLLLAAAFVWAYFSAMSLLVTAWWQQPEYGHGFFVPLFALALLWLRREMIDPLPESGSWWGVAFLGVWALLRWSSAYYFYQLFDSFSMLPCLAGLALFVGGWRALRWAWPSIVFLVFMVPLPGFLSGALSFPLQRIGTITSVFVIQTMGIPAVAQGNVIILENTELGVVDACSGLRMLMLFIAVCVGYAFVVRCALWEKVVIVLSSAPIAVCSNVVRITVTALLYHLDLGELADKVFHDMAGLLMMPLAMILLWCEMTLLGKLFLEPVSASPLSLSGSLVAQSGHRDSTATNPQEL